MNFADQLRKAPDEEKKRIEKERQDNFNQFINGWCDRLKLSCMSAAKAGRTQIRSELRYYVDEIQRENEYASSAKQWWKQIKARVVCCLNPKSSLETVCVTKEDAEYIESAVKRKLESEGLTVTFERKAKQKYRMESVYVKRSDSERLANSFFNVFLDADLDDSEGSYKRHKVEDGYMYELIVDVRW